MELWPDYDERDIMRAWETFVTDGEEDDVGDVRPLIKESWHRCALSAIDATRDEAPIAQGESQIEQLRHESRELREAARDSFARSGRLLEGAEADVNMRIKMGQSSDVYALVKADGKFYMTKKEIKVTLGGCGG